MAVEEGQKVDKGELLATLDTKELDLELRQLQIQQINQQKAYQSNLNSLKLQQEETQLELNRAKNELEKAKRLYEAGAVSRQDFEEIETRVEVAQINLEKIEEEFKLLEASQDLEAIQTQIEL